MGAKEYERNGKNRNQESGKKEMEIKDYERNGKERNQESERKKWKQRNTKGMLRKGTKRPKRGVMSESGVTGREKKKEREK